MEENCIRLGAPRNAGSFGLHVGHLMWCLSQWPVGGSFLVISVGQWGCSVAVSSLMAPDGSSDPWNIFFVSCVHTRNTHTSRRFRNNLGAAVRNFLHDRIQ
jgi:hypothetical protein